MASIYDITFRTAFRLLLPPKKRLTKITAFIYVLAKPFQYLRDLFFDTYLKGSSDAAYDALLSYAVGDRVRWTNLSVYECIQATSPGTDPTDTDYWVKIQDIYIGLRTRIEWNGQKLMIERALYEWFVDYGISWNSPGLNSIYIITNDVQAGSFLVGISSDDSSTAVLSIGAKSFVGLDYNGISNAFTIYVPTAVFNAIGSNTNEREGRIRALVDKIVLAGMNYDITTY